MEKPDREMQARIHALLLEQPLAVLSTQRNGQPYSSLMAFAYTDDLRVIMLATGKSTRKHQNIMTSAKVSLLVDNRSNSEEDFHSAAALTIVGVARLIEDEERPAYERIYLKRHPYLQKFLRSPSTTFFKIEVRHYLLVSRFQNVMEFRVGDEIDLFG
jgi:nitroimidazol reductase NimA-like FMN-containing flavoprotein (pyridoxamine 5'-phosphate oxidase superfamily)